MRAGRVAGKVALITGAGMGLGRATAQLLACEGAKVICTDVSLPDVEETVRLITAAGGVARAYGCDARKEEDVIALIEDIETRLGPIEAFVFNIGANVPCSILEETARKYFKIWEMACFSGFLNAREVAKRMVTRQRGTILFTGATAGLRATIPLMQGGRTGALRRQAQQRASATLENEIATERDVISQVRASYSSWRASNDVIFSSQSAVDAATLSLEGVRAENSVGNRTILDILNAEQELLNAQVQLETAKRNAYVAGFSLLAAMGRAEARDLGLDGGALYDPDTNYNRVRGKFFDWDSDPAPQAKATRTVDTPAQDGSIRDK